MNGCTKPERLAATMPFRTWLGLGQVRGQVRVKVRARARVRVRLRVRARERVRVRGRVPHRDGREEV